MTQWFFIRLHVHLPGAEQPEASPRLLVQEGEPAKVKIDYRLPDGPHSFALTVLARASAPAPAR